MAMKVVALTEQPSCHLAVFGFGAAVASEAISEPGFVAHLPGIAVRAALDPNERAAFLLGAKCVRADFEQVGSHAEPRHFEGVT